MMSKISIVAAALALSVHAAPRLHGCPKDYKPMESFDVERYMGLWYEIVRDKYIPFELVEECITAEYTSNEDGTFDVFN